jgi:hypothetical protein
MSKKPLSSLEQALAEAMQPKPDRKPPVRPQGVYCDPIFFPFFSALVGKGAIR